MGKSATWSVTWNADAARYELSEQTEQGMVVSGTDVEGNAWQQWLEHVSSFSFRSKDGSHVTVYKERRSRARAYWIAFRRVGGTLKRKYLGPSRQVTLAQLEQAAMALAEPKRSVSPLPVVDQHEVPPQDQVLLTKFFLPTFSHTLLPRSRLQTLLDESVRYPLTLISAPAGFGKTTLLSCWVQSLPPEAPRVVWMSLDEEDNDPVRFWSAVLTAFDRSVPGLGTPYLAFLRTQQSPPLQYLLTAFIKALSTRTERWLFILDDYHVITEQAVQASFAYLVDHLPDQLHLILSTRADPPLPLSRLRAKRYLLEVRTDQLRCTPGEATAFLNEVMGIKLPANIIEELTARTEGWLVGLQLLGLSLQGSAVFGDIVETLSGSQRYILDYLIDEVLQRQDVFVQTFLLQTSILERLSALLCDTVMERSGSQQMLEQLEHTNVFVVSLDTQRCWYRYHALFAEALRYRLEQTQRDLVPTLHHRASVWYAEHSQLTQAILHAFRAHEWEWAADLLERMPVSIIGGTGEQELILLRHWLEQLPAQIVRARPRLCLACAQTMYQVALPAQLEAWLDAAEAALTYALSTPVEDEEQPSYLPQGRPERANLLGEVLAFRAFLLGYQEDGQAVLSLCQRALALLSEQNAMVRAQVAYAQSRAYFFSSANDAEAATMSALEASTLAQKAGKTSLAIYYLAVATYYLIEMGQLHEAWRITQQAIQLGEEPGRLLLPEVSWHYADQADILREWNQLDAALDRAKRAIPLSKQAESLHGELVGYTVLASVYLSRGEMEAARATLQQYEHIGMSMNPHLYIFMRSRNVTMDKVRLWLASGEMNHATRWAREFDEGERHGTLFMHEREEVARVRILLAQDKPALALERLETPLIRATTAQRWDNVIEMLLLKAQAHQMCQREQEALSVLSQAVHLAEPGGYIRSFVDEGPAIETLLLILREQHRRRGPISYLDTVLAAFPQDEHRNDLLRERVSQRPPQPLLDPLSTRELDVLHELAHGASNQEIAEALVLSVDTVKRHVSTILSKLEVNNRTQAVVRARALGLLSGDS